MRFLAAFLFVFVVGCASGETTAQKRERATSEINVLLKDWDGTPEYFIGLQKTDPWCNPYIFIYVGSRRAGSMEARSAGPDGHPLNHDDIKTIVYRANDLLVTSQLNTLANTWDGTEVFVVKDEDPWKTPFIHIVNKGSLSYTLELRSAGPDKLPGNADDFVVYRSKRHGENTINAELEKGSESITRGLGRGLTKGLIEGWRGKK